MSRKTRFILVALLLLAFFGWRQVRDRVQDAPADNTAVAAGKDAAAARTPSAPAPPRMFGSIAFHPCTLASPMGGAGVAAQCGTLSVAEDPAKPQGRRIALNLAWIPAGEGADDPRNPVFMLAGGPGQAAVATYPTVAPAFREVAKHRDVVLVDQRGTGDSNLLQCADMLEALGGGDDADEAGDEAASRAAMREATAHCRDTLSRHADLRFYTTTDAVRDLDTVRQALGVEQVNLLGISYGTRVAQRYAGTYPQHVRALVLDSPAPNELVLGNDFARNLEDALALQFGRCAKIPDCANALGDPRAQLDSLMARLRDDPPLVTYRDANSGRQQQERLQPARIVGLARMYAYSPMAASILPLLIHEGAQGRYDGLMALSKMLADSLPEQMAYGMQLSVICSEDADGLRADPDMAASLLGNELVDGLLTQCEAWPKGTRPDDFHKPLASNLPTLLLSGELDPVTPPAYAEQIARTLPNSRVLVLRGQGHNVIGTGCMPRLFAQFLDTADARGLDAKCLDKLAYTPPFTSFNGWGP
ncbi:alpha/beta hydrolase [Luteimonas lutimaris]|uniref:Alpha/beta hydrolase n=1 Tax=Luteimonas lutimaris TaxID=698645 RepID=A0ABP7M1M1_9GAMM